MTIQSELQNILKAIQSFEQPGIYLILCAAAFLLVLLFGKRKGRTAFVYPLLLFCLAVGNSYIYSRILERQQDGNDVNAMLLWTVPFALIAAAGVFSLCRKFQKKLPRIITVCVFLVLLVLTGAPAVTEASWYTSGIEHLTDVDEGAAAADLIAGQMDTDTADVYVEGEETAAQIRSRNASLFCTLGDAKKGLSAKEVSDMETDFFVVQSGGASDQALQSDCTLIGKSGAYSVYKK